MNGNIVIYFDKDKKVDHVVKCVCYAVYAYMYGNRDFPLQYPLCHFKKLTTFPLLITLINFYSFC